MSPFSSSSGSSTSAGDTPDWFRFFFSWIFPLIFTLIGGGLLFFGLKDVRSAKASHDWPHVKGVVISSALQRYRSDDGTTYAAEVLYQYSIQGVVYSSNQVSFGEIRTSNPSGGQKIVNRFPAGSEVSVFVNPENADESVLLPGISGGTLFLPGLGAIFFCIGLGLYGVLPKVFRSGRRSDNGDYVRPLEIEHRRKAMEE